MRRLTGLSVLVVDDNVTNRRVLSDILCGGALASLGSQWLGSNGFDPASV